VFRHGAVGASIYLWRALFSRAMSPEIRSAVYQVRSVKGGNARQPLTRKGSKVLRGQIASGPALATSAT
jgi:hypothetical protein